VIKWIAPLVSLLLALLVAEGLCRVFFETTFSSRPMAPGIRYDIRWGPIHEPGADYVSESPTGGQSFRMSINSHGFRNPEIPAASAGRFRIAFIGDSFTEGYGVEFEEGFVALSERALQERVGDSEVETINMGMRGGSPSTYWRQLERTLELSPDGLVLVAYDNDLSDDFHYSYSLDPIRSDVYRAIDWLPFDSRLVETFAEIFVRARYERALSRSEEIVGGQPLRASEWNFGAGTVDADPVGFYARPGLWERHWATSRDYLARIATEVASRGVKFAIAYIPCPQIGIHGDCCQGLYPVAEGKRPGEENVFRDWLRELAAEQDVPFIDVSEKFLELEALGDQELVYLPDDGHLNERGNAIVADVIADRLRGWVDE